jgi:hypothetical protein
MFSMVRSRIRMAIWGGLNWQHLVRLGPDNIWHRMTDPVAASGHISKVFIDSSDTQWVIENDLLYRRFKGQTGFSSTNIYVYGPAKLIESTDHTLRRAWTLEVQSGELVAFPPQFGLTRSLWNVW